MKNYKQSDKLLQLLKKADRVFVNVHRHPDIDSIASAVLVKRFLTAMGKAVTVGTPHEIKEDFSYIKEVKEIETVDYQATDFAKFDIFLAVDSSSWDQIADDKNYLGPKIPVAVIDHHQTNKLPGNAAVVDHQACATAEVIFRLFEDWGTAIDPPMATILFLGMAGDSLFFTQTERPKESYRIADRLIQLGADKDLAVDKLQYSYNFNTIKMLGLFIEKMQLDKDHCFVWSAVSYQDFVRFDKPFLAKETAANIILRGIKEVDFGLAVLEVEKNKIMVSWRAKPGFDVSVKARAMGGGGHKLAAGCTLTGKFSEVVEKILQTARSK